jgi:hypothetical protein
MLDGEVLTLKETNMQTSGMTVLTSITKSGRSITVQTMDVTDYTLDGMILTSGVTTITYKEDNSEIFRITSGTDSRGYYTEYINYYQNGTIKLEENLDAEHNFYTTDSNITKYAGSILSYEELLTQNPIQTYDDATNVFMDMNKESVEAINKNQLSTENILVFTADYGLYWWDYKGGYDVVFAELGWNHSVAQQIGLVRGAANLQGKSWGTILTWKYTTPPFLAGGEEMFEQMKMSYDAGAEYVIIFNYSEDHTNPNILQEEHFQALERF